MKQVAQFGWMTLVLVIVAVGVGFSIWMRQPAMQAAAPPVRTPVDLTAWVVDWQWESGLADAGELDKALSRVQAFAAYFDESDQPYLTKAFQEALPQIRETAEAAGIGELNLTLVNDIVRQDGGESPKDSELVSRLVSTKVAREKHIAEIEALLDQYSFQGVEIDYERIPDKDWGYMNAFYRELYERIHAKGKSLRIVLESRAPVETLKLPEGPEYVMMAYNLYGTHSGPGPKADKAFLKKLAKRMTAVPGVKTIAIAAGGFDWHGDQVTAITEQQAVKMRYTNGSDLKRDAASGSLHYQYTDDKNVKHTVWYADGSTLTSWIDTLRQAGISHVAVWRLGELGSGTLDKLVQAATTAK
ncbi:glycosyl hydrolase family 18 protein [Paenibacillus cellulositrophicus]|uniref:glycosyl hydrolase family 18 protein n=1 Tax=Paenibacillus cellulositrophicus TaxID=562959 RepID=UPI00203ADCC1|nr:glycosyl hydrolase family 18 protein [Paenibacillus cellulositrophicus]MCM2997944.1 glycosyl hydrolase family 18 protein [Paenibacillus cellulositrophicus]